MTRRSREPKGSRPLSLAVMLSFNELAWIAAGGVIVMFVVFWNQHLDYVAKHPTAVSIEELATLEQRPVLGPNDLVVSRLDVSNKVWLTQSELRQLTNRPYLKTNQAAVDATWLAQLAKTERDTLRITLTEYDSLNKRPRVEDDQQIVPKSLVASAITNQAFASGLQEDMRALTNRLARQVAAFDSLQINNKILSERIASASQLPQELLNLRGRMNNVAILLDQSASMKEEGRWTNTLEVVETWLKHLTIKRCVLILFSDSIVTIPESGGLVRMNPAERDRLINRVRALTPQGNTATVAALRTVYENYLANPDSSVDTIILFTDGKPFIPRTGRRAGRDGFGGDSSAISREHMRQAIELVRMHTNIPINVVGLGDYFDRDQAEFLLELKNATGGAFLGR